MTPWYLPYNSGLTWIWLILWEIHTKGKVPLHAVNIYIYMAVCQNLVPLVNIKIAGRWMFIPLKMVLIGIDPYPYSTPTCFMYHLFFPAYSLLFMGLLHGHTSYAKSATKQAPLTSCRGSARNSPIQRRGWHPLRHRTTALRRDLPLYKLVHNCFRAGLIDQSVSGDAHGISWMSIS